MPHYDFQVTTINISIECGHTFTPKDPWIFGCKTTQNYPF
jgi:hypothetical protein